MRKYSVLLVCLLLCLPVFGQGIFNQGGFSRSFSAVLGQNVNDEFMIENYGAGTIGFYAVPPTGGIVTFEISFDGDNWEAVSIRSTTTDTWQSTIDTAGNYIGSISSTRFIRLRTSTAGSAPGSAGGAISQDVSIQEGIEFGAPPHRFGYLPIHVDGHYTTAQTATVIFTADAGKISAVTDFYIVVSGSTDCIVKIFDETDSSGNYIFYSAIEVATNKNFTFGHSFVTPYVASAAGNSWKITTSADCDLDLIGHGYQF